MTENNNTMTKEIASQFDLKATLRAAFEMQGNKEVIAIWSRKGQRDAYTSAELAGMAETIASELRAWLGEGSHTLVLALPMGIEFIGVMLGAFWADITIVPVPLPRMGAQSDRFQQIVKDSQASAILCLPRHVELLNSVLRAGSAQPCQVVPLPLSSSTCAPVLFSRDTTPSAPSLIQYTSGSTRAPKGVRVLGGNIVANSNLVQRSWGLNQNARVVNWLPHYHDMGLMGGILYPLLAGGFSAQIDPLDFIRRPSFWLEVIDAERANFSGGATFGYSEVLRRVPAEKTRQLDLSCWTNAYCGAEPVPANLLPTFHAHLAATGFPRDALFACYGMAEMTLFAAGIRGDAEHHAKVAPCHLTPELAQMCAIVDPVSGARLADGQEGEIWLRGPSRAEGYLNQPNETGTTFGQSLDGQADWLRTGDIGYKTGEALFVIGRIKDIVICNGRNIAAPEIEWHACQQHEALNAMSAAAFAPDPNQSGDAVLIAELHTKNLASQEREHICQNIRKTLQGEMGLNMVDIILVPRGRLERTSSGKIRRSSVAAAWRADCSSYTPTDEEV
ncbi:MAG: acyl-CoA synthetase (AMP-forming)/AMP-acid ligase II [Pseudophaeobacter arcticus]|jgi:acyl-CoA synthetase (AMP-forming)/AMP-acid ligase II